MTLRGFVTERNVKGKIVTRAFIARRLLFASIVLVCFCMAGARRMPAQQPRYSQTQEYQRMLEEIRTPAPSPAVVATGKRPEVDKSVSVTVKDSAASYSVETVVVQFAFGKNELALSMHNRQTGAEWTISLAGEQQCTNTTKAKTSSTSVRAAGKNTWIAVASTPCGQRSWMLEVLQQGLARLTLQMAEPGNKGVALRIDGGGPYFGLGERFWQTGLSGTTMDVRPQDRYGEPGHNWTYVAIPLVYTPGGLGIYADTAFDTKFRFPERGQSFDVQVAGAPVPLYLFTESEPKAVLSAYTAITGRPQNPPLWTFGPWITALGGKGAVLDVAQRIRDEGMAASALWIYDQNDEADNLGWPFWFSSYYGDPRAFVDTLHGLGFKVLTYVHPYVRSEILPYTNPSPQFAKGQTDRLLVAGEDGKPAGPRFEMVPVGNVDFTNPEAVDWWQGMITNAVGKQGFDGWMEDFGEWVRDTDRFAAGTGRTLSELYPLLYHKVTLRVAQGLNPAVAPFSRSGSPGSQAFSPVLWGADQWPNWSRDYGLPSVVTAGITAGMSGFSTWGPDILSTGDNKELWMRWVEFGALTPVMRDHVWNKPEHSFNLFSDPETTAHFRRWAAFHSSLVPYFATYAAEAARTGVPIMRHLVLEYPKDPRSATAEYEYLLGREMLVAPVVQPGQALRSLYLPEGEWVNFWNGDYLTGGQDATVVSTVIPILVRAGSVLPFKPEEEAGRWDWSDPHLLESSLVWRAYLSRTGAADSMFKLPTGTAARFQQRGSTATVTGIGGVPHETEVILRTKVPPTGVRMNGSAMPGFTAAFGDRTATQWWWNPSTSEVHVRFRAAAFLVEINGVSATQYGDN